jgi:hypothetical protein
MSFSKFVSCKDVIASGFFSFIICSAWVLVILLLGELFIAASRASFISLLVGIAVMVELAPSPERNQLGGFVGRRAG